MKIGIVGPGRIVGEELERIAAQTLATKWAPMSGFFGDGMNRDATLFAREDSVMQALGSYEGGSMFFLGLGTGLAS